MASFTYCVEYMFHHWNIIVVTVDCWWEIKNWFLHLTLYTSWRWAHVWLSVSEIWVSASCMCVFVCVCACMWVCMCVCLCLSVCLTDRHAHTGTLTQSRQRHTDTHIHTHVVYLSLCQCVHVCECSLVCVCAYKCTCKSTHVCLIHICHIQVSIRKNKLNQAYLDKFLCLCTTVRVGWQNVSNVFNTCNPWLYTCTHNAMCSVLSEVYTSIVQWGYCPAMLLRFCQLSGLPGSR